MFVKVDLPSLSNAEWVINLDKVCAMVASYTWEPDFKEGHWMVSVWLIMEGLVEGQRQTLSEPEYIKLCKAMKVPYAKPGK